jgi:outer membrane protein OmpA-like peptidoglycan-associated protein/tetratricopeptide (TPR) repeat protein
MKKIILIAIVAILAHVAHGQGNVEFIKKNFPNDKAGYKKAMDSLAKGDEYMGMQPPIYNFALPYYLSAQKFNPNNDQLNYKIGVCLLNSSFKTLAISYFEKAFKLNPTVAYDIHYCLGRAYHLDMQWDKAIQEFNTFIQTLDPKKQAEDLARGKKEIEECHNGIELVKHPIRVFIDNVGPKINTKYPEYSELISADESVMLFTSRRPNTTGGKIDPSSGDYFEDIYISYFRNGNWTEAQNLGTPVNTEDHDATAGLSLDGQILYVYRFTESNGGDIYQSFLEGDAWSKPKDMGTKINSKYHESSVSLAPDNKTLYFVSDRPGGYGDRDIYKIVLNGKAKWGDPENLGPVINSQYAEEGAAIQADGKTLYFSSKGHYTMGGYDIFKSVYDNGKWSEPENIGYPVNSPDDDVFFVMAASGKHGYYTSAQKDGYGEKDIYKITFLGPEKPVALSDEDNLLAGSNASIKDVMMTEAVAVHTVKTTLLKGVITDSVTHLPLEASIELVDNKKNTVIASFTSNSKTGKYLVSLPSGVNYGIAVKAQNYLFYSANFDIPDTASYMVVERNVALQPLTVGSRIVLRNIFFDFDKATLRPESQTELDRLVNLLTTYSKLHIEISGYTDSKGSQAYNQKLSESRSKSVVDYLVAHGISADRLTFKGYGMDNPIATNETDEGRQLNRRTEFKITAN